MQIARLLIRINLRSKFIHLIRGNDATLMQFCYKFDASPCYRIWWKGRLNYVEKLISVCIVNVYVFSIYRITIIMEE